MSGSVAEFMEKDVQKYACGERAQQAKKVLAAAFTASDSKKQKEESAEFERLIDQVMKTDKGRDTLTELSELGYTFAFETGDYGGFCEPLAKKIVVNPTFGDAYAMQTIVHEGQHAIQSAHEPENTPKTEQMTVASLLRRERAMEADACAHESAFIYQCRDILPEVYAEAEKNDMPMFRAFVAEMDKSGDEKKAMQAGFQAWYGYDYFRDYYDDVYRREIAFCADEGKESGRKDLFCKTVPAQDVADACLYKGKSYVSADMLMTDQAFSVLKKDKAAYMKITADYAEAVGVKADESVWAMAERDKTGKITRPAQRKANTAVAAALRENGGR